MRLLISVFVGFGLLSLTSCSETQQAQSEAIAPDATFTAWNMDSTKPSAVDSHDDGHAHHDQAEGQHHSVDRARHRRGSHGHRHGGHGHWSEDQPGDNSKKMAIGEKVPDFEVTVNGKKWKLSELQQKADMTEDGTLVLTFWCSFCHSCRHVEHQLDKLAKQYKGKAGVIALDASAGETTEGVAEFAEERGLTLPIALDSTGAAADIFGVRVTTTTVVIDGNGVLRYRGQFGDREHAFAEDALKAVLAGEEVRVKTTPHKG